MVDHISDINMPYSTLSREYLLREGFPPNRVIKTGSPMLEVLHYYLPKINRSTMMETLGLKPQEYFVLSCHREENVDDESNFLGVNRSPPGIGGLLQQPDHYDHPSPD